MLFYLPKSTESLLKAYSSTHNLKVRLGRDALYFGDFEDWDLDEEVLEAARWDTTKSSSSVCSYAYWGNGAVCSTNAFVRYKTHQVKEGLAFHLGEINWLHLC